MITKRQFLTGSACALVASTLPSQASPVLFEPLYVRLVNKPTSDFYNMPSGLYRHDEDRIVFYGRLTSNGESWNCWYPHERDGAGISAYLPKSTDLDRILSNEKEYNEYGMTVAEMPQEVRETHERVLNYRMETNNGNGIALL